MAAITDNITDTTGIRLEDAFVVIINTEWNVHVTALLEAGCIEMLTKNNIRYQLITVPGAMEIPFAVQQYWEHAATKPDAFITLGCVIRGETPHFEYVCNGVSQGVINLNLRLPVPVIFGVLTVNDQVQADERTGGRQGHKGIECAAAAIKMIALLRSLKSS